MTATAPFMSLLSKIVDNRGRTCPTAESGLPLIATNCVKNSTLYPVFEKVRYVDQHTYSTWFRGHPLPGDLIFVCKGSPGQVCVTPDPVNFCIAQDMVAVRADPAKVYPPYLFAALRSDEMQSAIVNMHVGTLIPHFKKGDFDKLEIPLPDEATQRFTGDMYLSLTEKIELNRRMNETLEGMAQAIFRDWFVDFGPTRRKAAGEAGPVPIMGGLTPDFDRAAELAALFPAAFGDDELPAGWARKTLGDRVDPRKGRNITKKTVAPGNVPVVAGGLEPAYYHNTPNVTGPVITASASGANAGFVRLYCQDIWASDCSFISREQTDHLFTIYTLLASRQDEIYKMQQGAAQPHIYPSDLKRLPICDAPEQIWDACEALLTPMFELVAHNNRENRTLAETRDYLLPRLMSGAVRVVPKAEAA